MRSQSGMTLIETMLLVGLVTLTLTSVLGMINSQQRQTARLGDKLASMDVRRALTSVIDDGTVCTLILNNAAVAPFDPANISNVIIPAFNSIPSTASAGAAPAVVADGLTQASPMSPRLFINSIRITGLKCVTAPCTSDSSQFDGVLEVSFDNTRTAGPVAPVTVPVRLQSAGPSGNHSFTSCGPAPDPAAGGGGGGGPGFSAQILVEPGSAESCGGGLPACTDESPLITVQCPTGWQVSGCGFWMSRWTDPELANGYSGENYDYLHANTPDISKTEGNGCAVRAGKSPGCGVCFIPYAACVRIQ